MYVHKHTRICHDISGGRDIILKVGHFDNNKKINKHRNEPLSSFGME